MVLSKVLAFFDKFVKIKYDFFVRRLIMIEVKEVSNKKMQKEFLNLPLKMYKDNPYFVPPLYSDEKNIFSPKKNVYFNDCEIVYYNAYKDGKMVGRIGGIIHNAYNKKVNEKRVRFTRFDCIDDVDVAKALFDKVESWAVGKGMEVAHGPLGFSDLEREGLLIEGFDELSTFEEQYNYEYYAKLIEACGYQKEVDWVEYQIDMPKEPLTKIQSISEKVLKKYNLKVVEFKSKKEILDNYADKVLDLLDEAYGDLYGTVPFTDKMRKSLIEQFKLILNKDLIVVVEDENKEVVAFGICLPSLAKAVQKSKGHLTPACIVKILKNVRHPEMMDLALIGVKKDHQNRGINGIVINMIINNAIKMGIKVAETNLNLEENEKVQSQWKFFEHRMHKRRRAYVKRLV